MCDRFSDYIVGSRHIAQMSSMHVFICMTGSCIKQLHISAGPAAAAGGAGKLHPHWDLQISSAQVAGETQNQIWMVQDWQLQPHHLWCKPLSLNPPWFHVSSCATPGTVQAVHGQEQEHGAADPGPVRGSSWWRAQDPRQVQQVHGLDCGDDAADIPPCQQGFYVLT